MPLGISSARSNALRDEQEIEAEPGSAGKVGRERVADGEHAAAVDPGRSLLLGTGERRLVGGRVGLAGPVHVAAHPLVELRDRAGAGKQHAANVDHEIRVGTDERHRACDRAVQHRPVVVRGLVEVVDEPGADDGLRHLRIDQLGGHAVEQHQVPIGAEMVQQAKPLRGDVRAHQVARGDDCIPRIPAHRLLVEKPDDALAGQRRVGEQDDGAAACPETGKRFSRCRKGKPAVVHHAPDVADEHVVALEQRRGMGDDRRWRVAHGRPARLRNTPYR